MAFWQENYGFIKVDHGMVYLIWYYEFLYQNVFDGRVHKMVENMDECEKSVAEVIKIIFKLHRYIPVINFQVLADKIYPLKEFRMVKENFLVRNNFYKFCRDFLNLCLENCEDCWRQRD